MTRRRNIALCAAFLVAGGVLYAAAPTARADCELGKLTIETGEGKAPVILTVEIANEPHELQRGLMYREHLPEGRGMIFVLDPPREAGFWMKNTLIPLDMLFFDEERVLRHIHQNAQPHDLTLVPGSAPGDPDPDRMFVLEIAGGEAGRLDLAPGARLADLTDLRMEDPSVCE